MGTKPFVIALVLGVAAGAPASSGLSKQTSDGVPKIMRSVQATGFVGCSDAQRRHFEYLTGDVRSVAKTIDGVPGLLVLQVASGNDEFAVLQTATVYRSKGKCIVTSTSVVSYPFGCGEYLKNNPVLKVVEQYPGHLLTTDRGIDVFVRSAGTGCTTTGTSIEGYIDDAAAEPGARLSR